MENEEEKNLRKTRKEKLAGFFYNLAQLTFAGFVVGGITPIFNDSTSPINWWCIVLGAYTTYIFANIANDTLKSK